MARAKLNRDLLKKNAKYLKNCIAFSGLYQPRDHSPGYSRILTVRSTGLGVTLGASFGAFRVRFSQVEFLIRASSF